jgi:hypothetical protein
MLWTLVSLIIIATILIALFIYYYRCHKVEKFTEPQVNIQDAVDGLTQLLASVGSGNIPEGSPYVETLSDVPSTLDFYLTSFSQRTKYDNSVKVYLPEMQRWYNFIKANQSFFVRPLSTSDLTASIYRTTTGTGGGMRLKNVALEGLRSDELAIETSTDYSLKSFSATFFMTFATGFTIPSSGCELFTISLESPNFVKLTMIDDDSTSGNCKFELQVGETAAHKITTGTVLKTSLVSGSPVAITIVCEITDNVKMNIYVGNYNSTNTPPYYQIVTSPTTVTYTPTSPLILGNSRMSINKYQKDLDANLLAFMFFSQPLTSTVHETITAYLATQNLPSTGLLSTLNNSATTQLQNIRELIKTNTATQGTLQAQLNACKATIAVTPVVKAFGHKITMDGVSSVSTEDLRACSLLEVKNRLTNAVAAASGTTATTPSATVATTPSATTGYSRAINMPPDTPASTTAIAP